MQWPATRPGLALCSLARWPIIVGELVANLQTLVEVCMVEETIFSGFPPAGLQFLADLADNNDRAWFGSHKSVYEQQLLPAAKAFIVALGEQLAALVPDIQYDTRTNGSGSLMRIYRDTRFSADKSPYRTSLGITFWMAGRKKMDGAGIFVRIAPAGAELYSGEYQFSPAALADYRAAVADEKQGAALVAALATVRAAGISQIGGEHYKRVPRGYDPAHDRADLLRYNGLYAVSPLIPPELLVQPSLVAVCFDYCQRMAPLMNWLLALPGRDAA